MYTFIDNILLIRAHYIYANCYTITRTHTQNLIGNGDCDEDCSLNIYTRSNVLAMDANSASEPLHHLSGNSDVSTPPPPHPHYYPLAAVVGIPTSG